MASTKLSQGELTQRCLVRSPGPLIDIGVNLADDAFDHDRDAVLSRAAAAGLSGIILTGCSVAGSTAARDLAEAPSPVPLHFTAGVHPHSAKSCTEETLAQLEQLAAHPRCVAIGECGLDFNRNFSPPDIQEYWFDQQVALARRLGKPLFLHCRDAYARFVEILSKHGGGEAGGGAAISGVAHCFQGSREELQACLDLGLHIGITGWVCDDRPDRGAAELAALLPAIPPERLMIETDAPYLTPRTIKPNKARPFRNEPCLLPYVLATVAQALGESEATVAVRTTQVAQRLFGLPAELVGSTGLAGPVEAVTQAAPAGS